MNVSREAGIALRIVECSQQFRIQVANIIALQFILRE